LLDLVDTLDLGVIVDASPQVLELRIVVPLHPLDVTDESFVILVHLIPPVTTAVVAVVFPRPVRDETGALAPLDDRARINQFLLPVVSDFVIAAVTAADCCLLAIRSEILEEGEVPTGGDGLLIEVSCLIGADREAPFQLFVYAFFWHIVHPSVSR
jgi:hypothetical protein